MILAKSEDDDKRKIRRLFEDHSRGGKARRDKIRKEFAEVVAQVASRYTKQNKK
jgi:hypothetical protein